MRARTESRSKKSDKISSKSNVSIVKPQQAEAEMKSTTTTNVKPTTESLVDERSTGSFESKLVTKGDKYLKINLNEFTKDDEDDGEEELIVSDAETLKDNEDSEDEEKNENRRKVIEENVESDSERELANLKSRRKKKKRKSHLMKCR